MAITLLANGLVLSGKWDELQSWLYPPLSPEAVAAVPVSLEEVEGDEDEQLAEQLYVEHQRWVERQEHDELVARQLEEDKQRVLGHLTPDELKAMQDELAAQSPTLRLQRSRPRGCRSTVQPSGGSRHVMRWVSSHL